MVNLILIVALGSSQFLLVNKILTLAMAWLALKSFYRKKSEQFVPLLTQKFWHTRIEEGKDLNEHLTAMSNLADEFEEVGRINVTDKDFMTTVYLSIIGIPRYSISSR